ncbi:hypothetical protein ACFSTC_61385 [Nonomuraea ferruginea]
MANVLGGPDVWVRRRRYLVDARPVQLATSYFPARLVEGSPITEADTGPGGVYARLRDLELPRPTSPRRSAPACPALARAPCSACSVGTPRHRRRPHRLRHRRNARGGQRNGPGRRGIRTPVRLRRLNQGRMSSDRLTCPPHDHCVL